MKINILLAFLFLNVKNINKNGFFVLSWVRHISLCKLRCFVRRMCCVYVSRSHACTVNNEQHPPTNEILLKSYFPSSQSFLCEREGNVYSETYTFIHHKYSWIAYSSPTFSCTNTYSKEKLKIKLQG